MCDVIFGDEPNAMFHLLFLQICIACLAYPICCTISNIFLVLTFIAYLMLPELHQSLFGRITMIFIVSLFLAYLTMSIRSFGGFELTIRKTECMVISFLIQVLF